MPVVSGVMVEKYVFWKVELDTIFSSGSVTSSLRRIWSLFIESMVIVNSFDVESIVTLELYDSWGFRVI